MPAIVPEVAIVSHNTDYYLLNLLTSLEPLQAAGTIGRVHVWDNASSDDTADLLSAYTATRPWLDAQRSDINVHHGPAMDALLREACESDWVLLLDADTEVRKPFDAALGAMDLTRAAFVGQIHPQMPHLYAYLSRLLVHRPRYFELPPFRHDGAPGVDYFRAIEREGRPFVRFRWCDHIDHFGEGSLRRVVERGDRGNEFYEFAAVYARRRPKSAERLRREQTLKAHLHTVLAASHGRGRVHTRTVAAPTNVVAARGRTLRPSWAAEAPFWIKSPRRAAWLRSARRMGLVQIYGEAYELTRLVEQMRATRVLEIGTAHGGSFLLWARAAVPNATLVSVDLPPWEMDDPAEEHKRRALTRLGKPDQQVHIVRGDSHQPNVRARVVDCFDAPIDFLFIDGDHSFAGVEADCRDYRPLVRRGGMIAFHDIHPHAKKWGGDVPAFWRSIREGYRHREIVSDPGQDGFGIGIIWV